MLLGCEPPLPQKLALADSHANGQKSLEWAQQRLAIHNTVGRNLQEAQESQKRYADKRRIGQSISFQEKYITRPLNTCIIAQEINNWAKKRRRN